MTLESSCMHVRMTRHSRKFWKLKSTLQLLSITLYRRFLDPYQATKEQPLGTGWGFIGVISIIQQQCKQIIRSCQIHTALKRKELELLWITRCAFLNLLKKLNNVNEKSSNNNQTMKQANNRPYALWCILLNQIHTKNYKTDIETNKKKLDKSF